MSADLKGRVAVITGAGNGLGRDYALLFAKLGAAVVVNDLGVTVNGEGQSAGAADAVAAEIKAAGGQALAHYGNVVDAKAAEDLIAQTIAVFGRVDIVVNNAGILRDRSFAKMTGKEFEDVVAVHLQGGFNVTHAAWPHMLEQGYGRIVLTTSAAGHNGNFGQANYGAAKLGLVGMMNCLAIEGRRKNVLVNAISPSAMTRMTENIPTGDIGQFLKADLVAPAVAWLASEAFTQSGVILQAIGGFYTRVAYFEGAGRQFDPLEPVTLDMLVAAGEQILDLTNAKPVQEGPLGDIETRLKSIGRL